MKKSYSIKIDAYSHIIPAKYLEALRKISTTVVTHKIIPTKPLYDLESRFRIMDMFDGLAQVLTLGWPAIEEVANSEKTEELAMLANDEMAELVMKYPDRFVAAIAYLPMNTMDAALKEADRAINDLKCRGVYLHSHVSGKPLDSAEFIPLYEKMFQYKLPIYIHPNRSNDFPDYKIEKESKYDIHSVFGWLYDTTVAMTRLVFSGILEIPRLKDRYTSLWRYGSIL